MVNPVANAGVAHTLEARLADARKRHVDGEYGTIPLLIVELGIRSNLLSAGQLKENGVQLQGDGDKMLLVAAIGEVLGRARYYGRVLCTDLHPCSMRSSPTEVVALGRSSRRRSRSVTGSMRDLRTPGRGVPGEGIHRLRRRQGHRPRPNMPLLSAAEWHGRAGDAHSRRVCEDDAAAHGRAAPLVAPRSTTSCLGAQLLGAVDDSAGDDSVQLLTRKKPDLTLARVWGCMVQFMAPERQRGGKLAPKACWGLHLGVSPESTGWEVLDLTHNKLVTSVEVIFYETPSLEPASGIASGRQDAKLIDQDGKLSTTGEQQTEELVEKKAAAGVQSTGELLKSAGGEQLVEGSKQLVDDLTVDEEGELSAGEESTDSDVVVVPIMKPELRRTG
ncbi:unnamed protein product [Closterium sp. NIES-54]